MSHPGLSHIENEHHTKTTLVLLPADGEAFWVLLPYWVSYYQAAAKKDLFLHPWGNRSGLRKQKKDKNQH